MAPVLDIQNLSTHIKLTSSVVQAVGNIDMQIDAGETLGVVGESGCGKSMTGLSIMGLLPPGGSIVGGSIKLDGRELVGLRPEEMRQVRGNDIAMIFQDPLTSLDPTKTIGYQVAEPVRLHRGVTRAEALDRAVEVLNLVGLPRPKERLGDLIADGLGRVQRGQRVLEDHRDLVAPDVPQFFTLQADEFPAVQLDRTPDDGPAGRQQSHDRQARHGLAATGFPDDAERLPGVDSHVNVADGLHDGLGELDMRRQVLDLKDWGHQAATSR